MTPKEKALKHLEEGIGALKCEEEAIDVALSAQANNFLNDLRKELFAITTSDNRKQLEDVYLYMKKFYGVDDE